MVGRPPEDDSNGHTTGERAQLVLIAAIIVATAILGAVVLLNTVHSSPDLAAQTDAQSVNNAERVVDQIKSELHALFLASGADTPDEQLPYVEDEDAFEEAVSSYAENFTALGATNGSVLLDVEYSGSVDGAVAYGEGGDLDDGETVIDGSGFNYARIFLNVTSVDESEFRVNITDESDQEFINVSDNDVEIGGETYEHDGPTRIELIDGVGEIWSDRSYDGGVDFDVSVGDLKFEDVGDSDFEFEISVPHAHCGTGSDNCKNADDINPTFEITYLDSNIAYESEFTLYEVAS